MEIEGQESVVETSESTESQSATPESSQTTEAPAQVAAPKPDETPFHEHPRFKELVEQKNRAQESTRALELKLAQLEGRLQSQPAQTKQAERDELIEDLRKIDPRLADRLVALASSTKTIEQLQSKLAEFEKAQSQSAQETLAKNAIAQKDALHERNKVAPSIRAAIDAQLNSLYYQGQLNLKDPAAIEKAYNAAYEPLRTYAEEMKREALKSYVPAKQADAKVPSSQPKGAPASKPKPAEKSQFKDREELTAAVAREFVQQQRAKREASPV